MGKSEIWEKQGDPCSRIVARTQPASWKIILKIHTVGIQCQSLLFQIVHAGDVLRLQFCRIQCRQKHSCKNRDDRYSVTLKKWIFYGKLWQKCILRPNLLLLDTMNENVGTWDFYIALTDLFQKIPA